jgi:hypothetical protein
VPLPSPPAKRMPMEFRLSPVRVRLRGAARRPSFIFPSPSALALQAGLDSGGSFGWLWHARTVLAFERSTACPGPMPVTPKVARHLRASMVGQLGAGLASLAFAFSPNLDQPADGLGAGQIGLFLRRQRNLLRCSPVMTAKRRNWETGSRVGGRTESCPGGFLMP